MTKVEVYNSEYTTLNHAYNEIFHAYEQLLECDDADDEVVSVLEMMLRAFNPTLDRIKSEMTVKTRYKPDDQQPATGLPPESPSDADEGDEEQKDQPPSSDGNVFTGNFTGE